MSDATPLILHHYDFSNYSEKVRLVLGFKGLAWHGVTIPAYEPKPDYVPLTAGYRRTPALQIGADVYCDTRLIIDVIDRRKPMPDLYPGYDRQQTRAQVEALTVWAEQGLMRPLALWITGEHAADFPSEFHADRARLHGKPQPDLERVRASAAKYEAQARLQLAMINDLLGEGQDYILAQGLSLADFTLVQAPWFLHRIDGEAAFPPGLERLHAWHARVIAVGHGEETPMSADDALELARAHEPVPVPPTAVSTAPERLRRGEAVTVTPFDQYSPAHGELLRLDDQRISIAAHHPRTGTVHVHFPRLGYRVGRQRSGATGDP